MATAAISLMPEISRAVGMPRTLVVPFELGCPFGMPTDSETQMAVLRALLAVIPRVDVPVVARF